jgi:hypothetical protein
MIELVLSLILSLSQISEDDYSHLHFARYEFGIEIHDRYQFCYFQVIYDREKQPAQIVHSCKEQDGLQTQS